MKVVLTEDIQGTGNKGDIVEVASGFARNYLLPRNMAVVATKENISLAEHQQAAEEFKEEQRKQEAEALAKQLEGKSVSIAMKTGEEGRLFGSVTTQEIADKLKEEHQLEIDRRRISLEEPIKSLGEYDIEVKPFANVSANIKVIVVEDK